MTCDTGRTVRRSPVILGVTAGNVEAEKPEIVGVPFRACER